MLVRYLTYYLYTHATYTLIHTSLVRHLYRTLRLPCALVHSVRIRPIHALYTLPYRIRPIHALYTLPYRIPYRTHDTSPTPVYVLICVPHAYLPTYPCRRYYPCGTPLSSYASRPRLP